VRSCSSARVGSQATNGTSAVGSLGQASDPVQLGWAEMLASRAAPCCVVLKFPAEFAPGLAGPPRTQIYYLSGRASGTGVVVDPLRVTVTFQVRPAGI
jgi:hypothetical protein